MSEPLLSGRPSSDVSDDQRAEAEDALLTGRRKNEDKARRHDFWAKIGLGLWASAATVAVIILAVVVADATKRNKVTASWPPTGKRNLVFMVSDGMGPTSLSLTRSYRQKSEGLPYGETLILDQHIIGTSRTRSSSSLVTDSAAGATAFGCAMKSYNGAIAVDPEGNPCGTVLEAAKKAGYMTGLVVTTRLTDATPACFSAHVHLRSEEDRIAEQQMGDYPLGRVVDLMLGGGRCHYLSNSTEHSCRQDNRDIVQEAQDKFGWQYISDRKSFDGLRGGNAAKLPLLGLFAPTDIPYNIDLKDDTYPRLHEMAQVALTALEAATKDSDQGFFLMIEGSRIDHAGHANDPAAQVREVLEYDKTFASVLEWVDAAKTPTVVVSTSDHETGGLAVARQLHEEYPEYLWYPGVLANASSSSEYLGSKYKRFSATDGDEDKFLTETILADGLGITDYSDEEMEKLKASKNSSETPPQYILADMISRRAQVGWSTHGHSGADVAIFASEGAERLRGNHENTEVGDFLRDYLAVDVASITKELQEKGTSMVSGVSTAEEHGNLAWMGKTLEELDKGDLDTNHLDCYHGDFRKHKH